MVKRISPHLASARLRRLAWVVIAMLMLAACATPPPPETPVPTEAIEPTATVVQPPVVEDEWARIQEAGVIEVASPLDNAPFNMYDEVLNPDGFDVALMQELARRLGLRVEFVDVPFEGLLGALRLGQVDAAIAAMAVTPDRQAEVDFTQTYYIGEDGILAAPDSDISAVETKADVVGRRIGVVEGTVYEWWLTENLVKTGEMPARNLHVYLRPDDAVRELGEGYVDLVLLDREPALSYEARGLTKLVGQSKYSQNFAIPVPRGSTLLPQLNDALAAAKADGTVARLIEQYLDIAPEDQAPIPTPAPTPATAPTATPATAVTPAPARCDPYTGYGNPLDLSVPDDTPMQPGQAFDKRWRIVNAGTCDWTAGYAFVYANKGERMGGQDAPIKVAVPVGGSLDISVPMLAPTAPGTHYGYWQMADANGKPFGKQVSVKIVVVAPPPPPTQPPPTNISWKVDRDRIKQGESANFTLNVTGARNVWFNEKGQPYVGVNGQSTQRVTPSRDTTYQLRVEQSDGRYWEDYKTIYVTQAVSRPEIVEFGINPQYETVIGQPVTLWWKVRGVVDGISLLRNGAQLNQTTAVESAWEDSPPAGDWTYELQAWGPGGSASPAYQQIRVKREPEQPPPDITRFDSNPQGSVLQGQCVELSWDIQGGWDGMELTVNGGTLTGGAGPSTYQDCQCPQNTGVCNYELRVWNQSGSDNAGLSLEVVMQTLPGNPAATFCQDNGGQYNGDQNTCTLPDGTVCDAWAYANGECPAPQ